MMAEAEALLTTARAAYARGDWRSANRDLSLARQLGELTTEDLDLYGSTAWWVGEVRDSLAISEDVYHRFEDDGDLTRAALKAITLGLLWFVRGDLVIASGWTSRARRLLADLPESVEHGYLRYLEAAIEVDFADLLPTREAASRLRELGRRLHAPQLMSLGLVLSGIADSRDGDTASGFAQLDEAMLPVIAGQLPPEWAGDIYCTVIHVCHALADLPRMRAWTRATEQWCQQFRGEVVYSGICRIHRLQLMCVEGSWDTAEGEIERSGSELIGRNNWVAGEAFYQLGELRRLRGDARGAQAAYHQARDLGSEPQPGESLLQHAAGEEDDAWAALCSALAGRDRVAAAGLLGAAVELALDRGLMGEAEQLCADLESTAADYRTPGFRAWAAHARATVLVAQRRYAEAIPVLRTAAAEYRTLQARHETARIHELLSRAYRGLGARDAAAADAAKALAIFRALGAMPDVQRLDGGPLPGGLTGREIDVLALITTGASNKAAADALFISQKTVSRHLANIFAKLDVSSRTAAAAWAHEHGLRARR